MTYCTFLERQHIVRDGKKIGGTSSSSKHYDTATKNPKHRDAVRAIASHFNSEPDAFSNLKRNKDNIRNYLKDRDHDLEVDRKARRMAEKTVKPNYNKARKDDKEFDKVERFETAADAARRHIRRHPQSESAGIFANIDLI